MINFNLPLKTLHHLHIKTLNLNCLICLFLTIFYFFIRPSGDKQNKDWLWSNQWLAKKISQCFNFSPSNNFFCAFVWNQWDLQSFYLVRVLVSKGCSQSERLSVLWSPACRQLPTKTDSLHIVIRLSVLLFQQSLLGVTVRFYEVTK